MSENSVLSRVAGVLDAANFAYGARVGASPAVVTVGNGSTGAGSSITVTGTVTLADGVRVYNPFSTNAPITTLDGANAETVTPSAVSANADGTVTITGDFTNQHSQGCPIASGTHGLQEALNAASADGGGTVVVGGDWPGTQAQLLAATVPAGVSVLDRRGPSGYGQVASGAADAINITAGRVVVTKAGVDAMTLATPTAGTNDFLELEVVSATAEAHTITTAANKINGGKDTATFGGAAGDSIRLMAYQGIWYAVMLNGVTLSEV